MTTCVRISVLDNGYTLSYDDPAARARNRSSGDAPWVDPERTRVYATVEALKADLDTLLPLLKPEPPEPAAEFNSAIAEAFASTSP